MNRCGGGVTRWEKEEEEEEAGRWDRPLETDVPDLWFIFFFREWMSLRDSVLIYNTIWVWLEAVDIN